MATQEKLLKSLEQLKQLINAKQSSSADNAQKKKEKTHHCYLIVEAIQNPSIKVAKNFNNLLNLTIDILLQLCDDLDSDTRMVADECLNKIIRSMNNGSITKIQIELHKAIKQNGPARSLRAALWRFASLAHHIRPHKGKVYVLNIMPALIQVFERTEESVHETLSTSLPLIIKALGPFTMDYNIKGLLNACLSNVQNASVVIRRMTASCILTICLNSRAPFVFLCYVFNHLFDLIIPIQDTHSNQLILGVLGCMKLIIPQFIETEKKHKAIGRYQGRNIVESSISIDKLLQIYELCLLFTSHDDHNIVNATLETLNVLLNNLPGELKSLLLQEQGIGKRQIFQVGSTKIRQRSPSQLSIATSIKSVENLLSQTDLNDFMTSNIEKWIDESKLSVINVNYVKDDKEEPILDALNQNIKNNETLNTECNIDYGNITIGTINDQYTESIRSESIVDNMEKLILSENSSENSFSHQIEEKSTNLELEYVGMNVEIGSFLDEDISLLYCSRLIVKKFLLNGIANTIPEKNVRVSIKNLALTCISSILRIYPNVLVKNLDKNCKKNCKAATVTAATDFELELSMQRISDILLYECHDDPQIRGVVRVLIANFIHTVLLQSFGDFNGWINTNSDYCDDLVNIKYLVHLMLKGLQDESSSCTRQCLTSLTTCLGSLLESEYSLEVIPILHFLPLMAQDPYWLVKVKLVELITTFSYITVEHVAKSKEFQNKVIHNILLEVLKDEDQRVRNASSAAIIKIIPLLYFEQNLAEESKITYKAICLKQSHSSYQIDNNIETNIKIKQQVANLPFPYNTGTNQADELIEKSLSRIISILYRKLLNQSTKYYTLGCIETLCKLSYAFPITSYKSAWNSFLSFQARWERPTFTSNNFASVPHTEEILTSSKDLLSLSVNLLTSTTVVYDIHCHLDLIKLVGNLFAGKWLENIKPSSELNLEASREVWDLFFDKELGPISEEYLTHLVKLLNIYAHVIEENHPVLPQSKQVLANLPSSSNWSPLKRRKSDLGDKKILSPGKTINEKDNEKKVDSRTNVMGYFANSPHYMKIYDILKIAHNNYKVTLNIEASENFLKFLRVVLYSLCQILEIATLIETGRIAEELLQYLNFTFTLEHTTTVQCVQQLLKSLFGSNISADADSFRKYFSKTDQKEEHNGGTGFFYHIAQVPIMNMSNCIGNFNHISKNELDGDSIVMGYVHRKDNKKIINKNMDQTLSNYIRIFEPMVIKSLKHYTITCDSKLQAQVLQLLSQLVLLRVNYCLLDSEQVFIDFVLKQFQFMEEGQIGLAHELIPKIFQFLVHLSYAKQHTKRIIVIPKIIQLCDGLMASGQSPETHCIPGLKPIVEDVFLLRNKSNTQDFIDLETTREVLISMMLKLIEYSDIIDLLVLILKESKYCENSERWIRWSKQIFDSYFAQLRNNKIELENPSCMEASRRLLFTLHPNVYKPISYIIIALFEEAIDMCTFPIDRYLAKINILFLITSQLNENSFLLKIEEITPEIPPHCIFEQFTMVLDPLNVSKTSGVFDGIPAELILLKYLFRTIAVAAKTCVDNELDEKQSNIVQQFESLLNYCIYLFQSGTHDRITNMAIRLLKGEMEIEGIPLAEANKYFLQLRSKRPLLTFQWCYILTLLNYNSRAFWAQIIQITDLYGIDIQITDSSIIPKVDSINMEIVRIGGTIVFADYLSEHTTTNGEEMSWFLVNNIKLIVENHQEPPIFELLGSIHRNAAPSSLLIQAIDSKCLDSATISMKAKILNCLENVHDSQTGSLLKILLPKMLDQKILAISRHASNLASRKVEYLLTLNSEEVQKQLPKEDLCTILDSIVSMKLMKKHETLIGLLNKLSSQFYDLSPVEFDQRRAINPQYIKNLSIDKAWYLSQVKQICLCSNVSAGDPEILSKLSYDELWTIMNHKDFNKQIIKDCFLWCMNHFECDAVIPNLLQVSATIINNSVNSLLSVVPKAHHVFMPEGRAASHAETKYSNRLKDILEEDSFYQFLTDLIPCVAQYVTATSYFTNLTIPETNQENFMRFAVISLEIILYNVNSSKTLFNINFISACLQCADLILKDSLMCNILASNAQVTWLCSAINSLFKFVGFLLTDLEPLPAMPLGNIKEALNNVETVPAGQAVHQLYILVCWLEKTDFNVIKIPNYLLHSITRIVISLARLPLVNSYVLTPPSAWKSGWIVKLSGPFHTQVPALPLEYLQESEILEEFIFRLVLLGWTSRTQFEESWVSLLSALSANPTIDSNIEDINAIVHSNSIAVQAITAILLQTLQIPQPGNNCVSSYIHVPRDRSIVDSTPTLRKLKALHSRFRQKLLEYPDYLKGSSRHMNVFEKHNIEKIDLTYSYSQMSLEYLRISTCIIEVNDENNYAAHICKQRMKKLQEIGLDLRSCLQFQLDFYTQWLASEEPVPLRLLQEIVKSIVQTSDIYHDRQQFQWMLDTCMELSRTHAVENEWVHLYLVIAICKASAVLSSGRDILEYAKKLISQSLKNSFLSSRIAGLHGLLYMLQMCVLDNTVIGGISEDMELFLPIGVDYIKYIISSNKSVLHQSEEHTLLVWALVFYIVEHVEFPHIEENFIESVFTTLLSTLSDSTINISVFLSLIKGVERLLIIQRIPRLFTNKFTKFATSQFQQHSPNTSLPAAQLLFTSLYMEYSEHIDISESNAIVPSNPDHLVQSIEKISAIFDKIKKGYPFEVELLSLSLSNLLIDIYSPSDILTKVISEFLSPNQRHPMQLCKIVFNIFESAIQQSQLSLLQDWVVFSLTNFTQSFSIGMATWCLTCFFISASHNTFLRNLYPYVQSRMGRYEYEDRKILCIAGSDFYNNLTDPSQKATFRSTLVSVKDQIDMPFYELLLCL